MLKDEVTRLKGCYSNGSINRHIAMAKAADAQALIDGKIKKQYLQQYPTLKENNIHYRILSDDERERLWKKLPEWIKPLWYFSNRVPCRISEIINLKKENLHLSSGRIFLNGSLTKNGDARKLTIYPEMYEYFETLPDDCEWLFFRSHKGILKPLGYKGKGSKLKPDIKKSME